MSTPTLNDAPVTILRNIGSTTQFFSFAGLNGATLAPGADSHFWGSVWDYWRNDDIQKAALASALTEGRCAIIKTPDVITYDSTLDEVWALSVVNGSVVATVPSYGSYFGPTPA